MSIEAAVWLGVILSSPVIFALSRMFFTWLLDLFDNDQQVEITFEDEHGNSTTRRINLAKSDDLLGLMDEIKAKSKKDLPVEQRSH